MSFFDDYFAYTGISEVPMIFHRWTALSLIGALIGRKVNCPFGHHAIYPNQYILLTGSPGSRKGSAIKVGTRLLKELQFEYFAPNRAAKEALWEWMSKQALLREVDEWIDDVIDNNIDSNFISQAYIATDEFLDFVGMGDDGLMTNLTNLWDNLSSYCHPKTRSKDIIVHNPTMNILSGITPGGIAESFKGLAMSGGFFSRILFIFSHPTSTKVTFPSPPNEKLKENLIANLNEMSLIEGTLSIQKYGAVYKFLDELYHNTPQMQDGRFAYYAQRRFTHLLKIITILCVSDCTLIPTIEHCILANTILAVAEYSMPNAIGEYGKSKHAEISNKIVEMITNSDMPLSNKIIWKTVSRDFEKYSIFVEIINNLISSERIQKVVVNNSAAFISCLNTKSNWNSTFINYSMLHPHEHHEDTGETSNVDSSNEQSVLR